MLENGEILLPGSTRYDSAICELSRIEYDRDEKYTVSGARYEYGSGVRVSSVAYDSVNLGAGISVCCRSYISLPDDWPVKNQDRLLKEIGNALKLSPLGYSAITSGPCFDTEGEEDYAAVLFYPRYLVVSGEVLDGDKWIGYEAWFPCLNRIGCVDGMYKLYTSCTLDLIPE